MSRLPSLRITTLWTPAHIGTTGNELADDAAKASTRLPPSPSLTISLTSCKRRIDLAILEKWDAMWKFSSTGRGLREIDDSPPSLILRSPYLSSAVAKRHIHHLPSAYRFLSTQRPPLPVPPCPVSVMRRVWCCERDPRPFPPSLPSLGTPTPPAPNGVVWNYSDVLHDRVHGHGIHHAEVDSYSTTACRPNSAAAAQSV
ncbi:hypothetical protein B0H14DRAFT_3902207 [Mycena olivaceomarginata]|nr:hypothetical protein B0H14DRAFT_3902207 [Mycena olivaceomarginata]